MIYCNLHCIYAVHLYMTCIILYQMNTLHYGKQVVSTMSCNQQHSVYFCIVMLCIILPRHNNERLTVNVVLAESVENYYIIYNICIYIIIYIYI